jgi:hypothetical protein
MLYGISFHHTLIVGVSLRLRGVTLSSDSLVAVDDILQFPESFAITPANNEYHNRSLLCLTDLENCCSNPPRRGSWHYPDGSEVTFNAGSNMFRRNRGPNQVLNDQQFYGSVRLFRQGNPTDRGRFRCELPNAANPFVNQIIYANICELTTIKKIDVVFAINFIVYLAISGHWSSEYHTLWLQHCRRKFHTGLLSKYCDTAGHTSTTLSVILWPK